MQRLADALGVAPEVFDKHSTETRYRTAVAAEHEFLDFTALGVIDRGEAMPMNRGFIPVPLMEASLQDRCSDTLAAGASECTVTGESVGAGSLQTNLPPPISIGTVMQRSKRLFILGDPGSGKTTLLRFLARTWATGGQKQRDLPPQNLVPVYLRLACWSEQLRVDPKTGLIAAALAQLPDLPDGTAEWLSGQCEGGTALLLLDGLDEVPDPDHRISLLDAICGLVREYPKARIIISSRIVGFDSPLSGERFVSYHVQPLAREAIEAFCAEWSALRHGHRTDRKCRECEERVRLVALSVRTDPAIQAFAANPMTLTILLLLDDAGVTLPRRRWDLYQKVCETFLFSWQEKKRQALSGAPDSSLKLDDREIQWVLESIALQMQQHDWTLVQRWWLNRHVAGFLRDELGFPPDGANAEADAIIWSLHVRSGLLVERGTGRFGFSHLAFQEYYAARAILSAENPIDALRPWFYHPRWREVIHLVSTQLDRRRVPQLFRAILDDPDPTGRFLHRGLLIVLECLSHGASMTDTSMLNAVGDEIKDLAKGPWLGISADVICRLAGLLQTRFEEFARKMVEAIVVASRPQDGDNFVLAWSYVHDFLPSKPEQGDDVPPMVVREIRVPFGGEENSFLLKIRPKRCGHDAVAAAIGQLQGEKSPKIRRAVAHWLESHIHELPEVKTELLRALDRETEASVRAAIVESLGPAAADDDIRSELERRAETDTDPSVQECCVESLGQAADTVRALRDKLFKLLSSPHKHLRAAAVAAVSGLLDKDAEIQNHLVEMMLDTREARRVRSRCIWVLRNVLRSHQDALSVVKASLQDNPEKGFARVSAEALAESLVAGKLSWPDVPVERLEHVLASLSQPCGCALRALRRLVNARELRRLGVPREARIQRALADSMDNIELMFIFGSTARDEQTADSDIDLMVIGDATLKDLAPGLRRAEQELNKQVNVVVYSVDDWQQRCRERNPFVQRVLSEKKIFLKGAQNELAAMAGK